ARERLAKHDAEVAAAKTAIQENEIAIKNLELDIGTRRQTITRLKQQQFETRKNEEYQAINHEVSRYNGEVDELETRELELMENGDRLARELEAAESAYATTHAGVQDEIKALEERATKFRAEADGLEAERAGLAAEADPDLLSLYDRLLATRGAPVVVGITESRQCTGCHVRATPATMVRVQGGKELVQCENCSRMLYPA
ncbi:MAG: hypothetical protein HKN82_05895, partial [Akkermansiaceae bacterium]|nr:hypothetical protein [Akkermansiaceae bacterium]